MKKWKKIVIILSTVAVLLVSVFAVSASASGAFDVSSIPYMLPTFNYAYIHPEYQALTYGGASGLAVNKGDTPIISGQYGYNGDPIENIMYNWRLYHSYTENENYCNVASSKNNYAISINMGYLKVNGTSNDSLEVGLRFEMSTEIGTSLTSSDRMEPSGTVLASYQRTADIRVTFIRDCVEHTFTFSVGNSPSNKFLSSYIGQYLRGNKIGDIDDGVACYVSRIDINLPETEGMYVTTYVRFYTKGYLFDDVYLKSLALPYDMSGLIQSYKDSSYNQGYSAGYGLGYDAGYDEMNFELGSLKSENITLKDNNSILQSELNTVTQQRDDAREGLSNSNAVLNFFQGIYEAVNGVIQTLFNINVFGMSLGSVMGILLIAVVVIIVLKIVI